MENILALHYPLILRQVIYAVLFVACSALWWRYDEICKRDDPLLRIPGPLCLPLIGSVLSFGNVPHLAFLELRKRYGDVYRVQIGSVPVVILNGVGVIREALVGQGDIFSGRPDLMTFRLASEGRSMAFNSFSPEWKLHRRLAERALKLVEIENQFVKKVIVKEANILAESMASHGEGVTFDPVPDITWSVARVMYSLCYGDSRETPDFREMIQNTLELIRCHQLGNALNFFPAFRFLMIRMRRQLMHVCDQMLRNTMAKEREHLDTYRDDEIRDAMDALIRLAVRRPCPLPTDQVLHTVQEFIGAGLDIIYMAVAWAVLYCAKYPEAREKMIEEIDSVVGRNRNPCENDIKSLPYTMAFALETIRYSCVVPMALPHSTLVDTTLAGYHIPADTMILLNLCSLHKDPETWGDPENFRPGRFIDDVTGGLDESRLEVFAGFGQGRRRCIGEQLAKQQLVIYMVAILQKCVFSGSGEKLDETSQSGIVLRPRDFHIQISPRD
ncbi:hypothetical protein LSH36_859g01016 [Paralvinella palmiformis]|uniref:unspecific monooxygenase n=1 Tax=Paralvinella palmiformis TaxID=53620 RepID=A0AAD9IYX1_9ANNE|nr:hypothetical protein LSH36_859g01016 [Paralvinella palmiformis]